MHFLRLDDTSPFSQFHDVLWLGTKSASFNEELKLNLLPMLRRAIRLGRDGDADCPDALICVRSILKHLELGALEVEHLALAHARHHHVSIRNVLALDGSHYWENLGRLG